MQRLWKHYKAHFLGYEFLLAVVVAAILVGIVEFAGVKADVLDVLTGNRQALYVALASIFGALLGFTITTVSIIAAFMPSPALSLVRESRHHETLYQVFFNTIRVLAFATALPLIAMLMDRDADPRLWVSYLVLTVSLISVTRVARSIWALERVVTLAIKKDDEANPNSNL